MPSMISLFRRLESDFPEFHFEKSEDFWWSASDSTVHLAVDNEHSQPFSLHELSHAVLGHHGYTYDVDLIKMERDAWHHAATQLAPRYDVEIDEQLIQNNLDTYRDWLHSRSSCPDCDASGIQTKQQYYRCLGCGASWRANEARMCALRRYAVQIK